MSFAGFPPEAFEFYEGLEADNSRTYWERHRATYERCVREPVAALLAELEADFGGPAKVFRPHRDLRFSADKSPYKTHQGGVLGDEAGAGALYLQVSAEGLLVAAGYYDTASDQVERLRAAVADDRTGRQLERVVVGLRRAGHEVGGVTLKTRPRGVDPDHPRIELLRHRTLTASRRWPPEPWVSTPEAADAVRAAWRDYEPLNAWLERHVGASRLPRR